MAKLTRKQRLSIESALYHAKRAHAYIQKPDIAVAVKSKHATTTLHYARADGATLYEVNKEYGSDLVGLQDAIDSLTRMLELDTSA